MRILALFLSLAVSVAAVAVPDFSGEDGYKLWQRYDVFNAALPAGSLNVVGDSDTTHIIRDEFRRAFGNRVSEKQGTLIVQQLNNELAARFKLGDNVSAQLSDEGFIIKSLGDDMLISAKTDIGLLYGSYHLLRMVFTQQSLDTVNVLQNPKIKRRVLNHWDDLDRHTERGYAGESIFDWHRLPVDKDQRYYDYARANASIGINGMVPLNVNANALILTPMYLQKVKALADIVRPYGIKMYLSIKFSSPQQLDGLPTSDPLDPAVQQWWQAKAAEIYQLIPDFGGFLVKANSEGQPGPGDYDRTHADGANMLAKALKPYKGVVFWRAFVYANDAEKERSLQAFDEFVPLDGEFMDNVIVQVKNGPIDFQPREPFSPLFGATPNTPLAMELQITQEYLGFSTHLAYLGTLFEEAMDADTHAKGPGSTVAKVVDGSLFNHQLTGIAGVANTGMQRNWTGHIFAQSNWYAFGRLAWDHTLSAEHIANEWIKQTLTVEPDAVAQIEAMMMPSREYIVEYMTPLGLHHLMDSGHHYGPGPWVDNLGRADWNPVYYHRADKQGIGIDRTAAGTNAVSQYAPYWQERFAQPQSTPKELLLWFHHLPWDYTMPNGETLWNELVRYYYRGVEGVTDMQSRWQQVKPYIDANQFRQVDMALQIQMQEAKWWRDASVLYFQTFSERPIPDGLPKPEGSLDYYQSLTFPYAPGQG
ncbi:alpha-glucuronidase [Alteromonas gilva]|uniref:Alpha-glucuronidase n=1 Tax=Alteromonas gilva TaxID=2987522 RepID=A0ABT5KZI5_9ALTE|nr:alpha-glucuronidase [Alteromonas gilva]MDC8829676.1 alpha-glucuronidase [Alteromonas gilva]